MVGRILLLAIVGMIALQPAAARADCLDEDCTLGIGSDTGATNTPPSEIDPYQGSTPEAIEAKLLDFAAWLATAPPSIPDLPDDVLTSEEGEGQSEDGEDSK